jgi:DNA polymerase (family 10)
MGSTQDLADIFDDIATLLEITGADKFRVNAHSRAARAIRESGTDIIALAADRAALLAIEGIGPKTADKIIEFAATGAVAERDELLAQVPPTLPELMQLQGLGPKTVRTLWQEGNITSIADLQRAIDDGSILNLPRMGKKTVENIAQAIAFRAQASTRLRLGVAMPIAESLVAAVLAVHGVTKAQFAGSLRRGQETIGDLDILAATTDPESLTKAFTTLPGVERILAAGESKASVQLRAGDHLVQADPKRLSVLRSCTSPDRKSTTSACASGP